MESLLRPQHTGHGIASHFPDCPIKRRNRLRTTLGTTRSKCFVHCLDEPTSSGVKRTVRRRVLLRQSLAGVDETSITRACTRERERVCATSLAQGLPHYGRIDERRPRRDKHQTEKVNGMRCWELRDGHPRKKRENPIFRKGLLEAPNGGPLVIST